MIKMRNLEQVAQIWKTRATPSDIQTALDYALVTIPWTFDRMSYGKTTVNSMQKRLANIMIGVLNQTILQRKLASLKISCNMDWTDYRQTDRFDFKIGNQVCDVKTTVVYTDYDASYNRPKFTPDLLIKNRTCQGPDWRCFFPQMVALSQFNPSAKKDRYIFGVAVTKRDIRKPVSDPRDKNGIWCTVPHGKASQFFHHRELIKKREMNKKGFRLNVHWKRSHEVINSHTYKLKMRLVGEWDGKQCVKHAVIEPNKLNCLRHKSSSLSSIVVDYPHRILPRDSIEITARNDYPDKVGKATDPTVDLNDSNFTWIVCCNSFINLKIKNYAVYWIGHISYGDFMKTFVSYPCYFAPRPNSFKNEEGILMAKLKEKFERLDRTRNRISDERVKERIPKFSLLVKKNKINAGVLVSARRPSGQVIGASCYYYPGAYAFHESAMYVLPRDLEVMDSLNTQGI